MTGRSPKRRFFAVKAEVADSIIRIASQGGLTLYGLVSDALEKVAELHNSGVSISEALESFRLTKTSKGIGLVIVPEHLWYETAEVSLKADRKGTMARFAESGEWIGKYALAKSQGSTRIEYLANCLAPLICDASEFVMEGMDSLHLRCVNPRHPPSYSDPFSVLLARAVETFGYECTSKTASKGMILLSFRRTSGVEQKVRGEIVA